MSYKPIKLQGIQASEGIGIGKLIKINFHKTYNERKKEAKGLFYNLKQNLLKKIHSLENVSVETAQIFEIYESILNDLYFEDLIDKYLNEELGLSEAIEKAVFEISNQLSQTNKYMKERIIDIERLAVALQNPDIDIHLDDDAICYGNSLAVIDLLGLDMSKIKGIITKNGSKISHLAIWCRNNDIPFVYNIEIKQLKEGSIAAIDLKGNVIIDPPEKLLNQLNKEKMQRDEIMAKAKLFKNDMLFFRGKKITIAANIGNLEEAYVAEEKAIKNVGLFRTEFIFLSKNRPLDEETQYKIYKKTASLFSGDVIIRTMDIGGDKELTYIHLESELNPSLGTRGLRLSLKYKDLFITQLRAILRAAYEQENIRIMFPMVTIENEIKQAKVIIEELANEMYKNNENYKVPPIGIMIEVPAAALSSDRLIRLVDFMSIGTNDLIQYTMAMDRTNNEVDYLYQPYHSAIIKLIQTVIDACHINNKQVSMCGEMAGEPLYYPLLLEMGLDEFSMEPSKTSLIKMYHSYLQKVKPKLLPWDESKLSELQELYNDFLKWIETKEFNKSKEA